MLECSQWQIANSVFEASDFDSRLCVPV